MKTLKSRTKNPVTECFGQQFLKNFLVFEISALEFVFEISALEFGAKIKILKFGTKNT